jgi:hypothetical protein
MTAAAGHTYMGPAASETAKILKLSDFVWNTCPRFYDYIHRASERDFPPKWSLQPVGFFVLLSLTGCFFALIAPPPAALLTRRPSPPPQTEQQGRAPGSTALS